MARQFFRRLSGQVGSGTGWTGTGPPPTDDLTVSTRDLLFEWQVRGDEFGRLDADSLYHAKICETKFYANRVLASCQSAGVIDPITGNPDTTKIDRTLVHKMAIISVPKQRELVNLLFFWEEELVRWRLLEEEEAKFNQQLSIPELRENERRPLEEHLKVVQAKKRVPPSLRSDSGEPVEGELPGYSA